MKELLKVMKRERHFNDTDEGLTYITTMELKEGKKGEPKYRKITLKVQDGNPEFYNSVDDGELIKVDVMNPQTRLTDTKLEQPQ